MEEKKASFLDQMEGQGSEEFGARDVKIPFIKIITNGCHEPEENHPAPRLN